MSKRILCLDLDGVLHAYTSGWQGADVIPDPPVEGAIAFLLKAVEHFDVQIFSSRSHQPGGIEAMRAWLRRHAEQYYTAQSTESGLRHGTAADALMERISFPTEKPPAFLTLDDRALTFEGTWPDIETLQSFQPWNKRSGA